jgi:hypothetical protein
VAGVPRGYPPSSRAVSASSLAVQSLSLLPLPLPLPASDYSAVPLCADCHRHAPDAYHRAGKGAFERRHGLCLARVVAGLNREWQSRCA